MPTRAESKTEYSLPRVAVISEDRSLVRKIELALLGEAEVIGELQGGCDLVLSDARGGEGEHGVAGAVPILRRAEMTEGVTALPYPFSFGELRALISGGRAASARLVTTGDGRHVSLDGEMIRLTEREYKLLSAILEGGGDFVSRDELVEKAFGEDAEGGILNVYIHYLREKLEVRGEKIILSSRKGGYRIDEKYLGGGR